MKQTYSFFFILAAVLLFSTSLQAKTKIELKGSILVFEPRSLTPIDSIHTTASNTQDVSEPIQAYNVSGAVYTAFNADLGYVLIEIVSSYTEEVVYSSIVDSGQEDSFIAPNTIDLASGGYYIRYTTVYGDALGDL